MWVDPVAHVVKFGLDDRCLFVVDVFLVINPEVPWFAVLELQGPRTGRQRAREGLVVPPDCDRPPLDVAAGQRRLVSSSNHSSHASGARRG
jgi:hypothetical protein